MNTYKYRFRNAFYILPTLFIEWDKYGEQRRYTLGFEWLKWGFYVENK